MLLDREPPVWKTLANGLIALWYGRGSTSQEITSSSFDCLSEEDIFAQLRDGNVRNHPISPLSQMGCYAPVYRFSADTVVKFRGPHLAFEAYMMAFISANTTIPVPTMRRCLSRPNQTLLFMEYIEGTDLEDVWPTLSLWKQLQIMWTLRGYVCQLRRLSLPDSAVIGPYDGTNTPHPCYNFVFGESPTRPISDMADLSVWFIRMREIITDMSRSPVYRSRFRLPNEPSTIPLLNNIGPLVFIHGDLSMRNVRLGNDGRLWMLDWGCSGVYPAWFEYVGMARYKSGWGEPKRWLWFALAGAVTGWYSAQFKSWKWLEGAVTYPNWEIGQCLDINTLMKRRKVKRVDQAAGDDTAWQAALQRANASMTADK